MNKNVLITGVAGLLGARLADWIVTNKPEYTVIGVDNLEGGYIENVHESVLFKKADCTDSVVMDSIFNEFKPEYVFHSSCKRNITWPVVDLTQFTIHHSYVTGISS